MNMQLRNEKWPDDAHGVFFLTENMHLPQEKSMFCVPKKNPAPPPCTFFL
jgi:hypothetical protein